MKSKIFLLLILAVFFVSVGIFAFEIDIIKLKTEQQEPISSFASFDSGDTRVIGYEFLDLEGNVKNASYGNVIHIWNGANIGDYFFDKDSGIQLTNHFQDYWTHNIFCGGYKNDLNEWVYDCNDALPFNWDIQTDNSTYVNITGYRDKTIKNKEVRLSLRYHLKLDDDSLSVQLSVKNLGGENITNDLGFAWRVKDIKIDGNNKNDHIIVNNEKYSLSDNLNNEYTNLDKSYYRLIDKSFVRLEWDNNLNYKLKVESKDEQYNAPVTLMINAGPLVSGQEKHTTLYWKDPLELFFEDFEAENLNDWTVTSNWAIDNDQKIDLWSAKCTQRNTCQMETDVSIDTLGYDNVNVTFRYMDNNLGNGNAVWYWKDNESNWDNMGSIDAGSLGDSDDNWNSHSLESSDLQYLHSGFAVRFWANPANKANYWIDNVNVSGVPTISVSWNETSIDLGESTTNITTLVEISSTGENTDTKVECIGHCTPITTNWTQRTMTNGQSETVLITCSNVTEGEFQAIFNVTSFEDTSSDLFTVDCEIFSYGTLNVSVSKPDDNSEWYKDYTNLTVNATVTCSGGTNAKCGTVSALARYNLSGSPNTDINVTKGGNPFYILNDGEGDYNLNQTSGTAWLRTQLNEFWISQSFIPPYTGILKNITVTARGSGTTDDFVCRIHTENATNADCPNISEDGNITGWVENGPTLDGTFQPFNLTFNVSVTKDTIYLFVCHAKTTTANWVEFETSGDDSGEYSGGIASRSGETSTTNWTNFEGGGGGSRDMVFFAYFNYSAPSVNLQTSPSIIPKDESWNASWTLNVTTASAEAYLLDVLFNSTTYYPSITENNTADRQVNLNPSGEPPAQCWAEITGGIYVPQGCTYYVPDNSYIT